jgi:hypothetical protein
MQNDAQVLGAIGADSSERACNPAADIGAAPATELERYKRLNNSERLESRPTAEVERLSDGPDWAFCAHTEAESKPPEKWGKDIPSLLAFFSNYGAMTTG